LGDAPKKRLPTKNLGGHCRQGDYKDKKQAKRTISGNENYVSSKMGTREWYKSIQSTNQEEVKKMHRNIDSRNKKQYEGREGRG